MSEGQINLLFSKLRDLVNDVAELKTAVHLAVSNSELVLAGYQEHGTAIENLAHRMERLRLRCPLMKPSTSELKKVEC
jgi:hypothetical protein